MKALQWCFVSLVAGLAATAAPSADAATVINVSLWDKGMETAMPTGIGYGVAGADPSKATMGIKIAPSSAPAGVVIFKVKNDSKDTIHEMIVMVLAAAGAPLPFIDNENRVDEDKAGDKGEVSELEPGKSGLLSVPLKPGKYLLICNVPGHYMAGMWTEFTVTP